MFIVNRPFASARTLSLTLCLLLFGFGNAYAKDYKVEMLVFENLNSASASKQFEYQDLAELPAPSKLWHLEPSMLNGDAERIENSGDYRLLHHFSWGQKSLPLSQAPSYNVTETDITGQVKVYARQLLFANLNLNFNGYQLNEKRRIKLNEKHFYDHPKFGILMRVSRL